MKYKSSFFFKAFFVILLLLFIFYYRTIVTTAFIFSVEKKHIPIAKVLVYLGADINSHKGRHALALAIVERNFDFAKFLIKHGAIWNKPIYSYQKYGGFSEISRAAQWNNLKLVKYLVENFNVDVNNKDLALLMWSAKGNAVDVAKYLIKKGANVNVGKIPPIVVAVKNNAKEVFKLLLDNNADVSYKFKFKDENNCTLLFPVAYYNWYDLIPNLVKNGLDVNAKNNNGNSPLHFASRNGCLDSVKTLLKLGADINALNKNKQTPLCVAGNDQVVKYLLEKKAVVKLCNLKFLLTHAVESDITTLAEIALKNGGDPNQYVASEGKRLLHIAAEMRFPDMCLLLLKYGADINGKDGNGRTPIFTLISGVSSGFVFVSVLYLKLFSYHIKTSKKEELLAFQTLLIFFIYSGADLNIQDNLGETPLHLATKAGLNYVVKKLVEAGAKLNIKDKRGKTPLDYAVLYNLKGKNKDLIDYLKSVGAKRGNEI